MTDTKIISYAPEVQTASDPKFYGNMLRFATEAEALAYAKDLMGRWTLVVQFRAVSSSCPVTHRWDFEHGKAVNITEAQAG